MVLRRGLRKEGLSADIAATGEDAAQHISLGEPGRRLPVPRADDELARLAHTLNEMLREARLPSNASGRSSRTPATGFARHWQPSERSSTSHSKSRPRD
jgi:hypothetical protein